MPYGQPYGIDQSATVTILMQHFHKFFGKFITGPYLLECLSHDVMGLPQDLAAKIHGLSPSCSHRSLLFDQRFSNKAQLQRHLANRNAI